MSDYAWIITKDHLEEDPKADGAALGVTGPRDAPEELLAELRDGKGHTFKLYDDDQVLYYTGRLITTGDMADEAHCAAPLDDFGAGWAGCVTVVWPGHHEWDCG